MNLIQLVSQPKSNELLNFLFKSNLLNNISPELFALYGVPQNPEHHPEVDTGIHTEMCLKLAESLNASPRAKFAVLLHDLGKALTPKEELPKHINHEITGIEPVKTVCQREGVEPDWSKLALLVCEYHLCAHRAFEMRSKSLVKTFQDSKLDTCEESFFEDFITACEADKRGRLGKEEKPYLQGKFLREVYSVLSANSYPENTDMYSKGVGLETYLTRLHLVKNLKKKYID